MGHVFKDEQGNVTVHVPTATAGTPMPAKRPSGYLDTNLISGLVKEDLGTEQPALTELLRRRKAGEISLCTSHVASEELARIPPHVRAGHEDIYLLLDDVPSVDEQFEMPKVYGAGAYGADRYGKGPIVEDATLGVLRSIVPDADDARHIFQAAKNGIDYFITRDEKTIVRHATDIESAVGIVVRLPSQMVADLARPTS